MKTVMIESPYSDGGILSDSAIAMRTTYARLCLLDSIKRGELPLASHLIYTQVLNDRNKEQRKLGLKLGKQLTKFCDKVVFYTDLGYTLGMNDALKNAQENFIQVEERKLDPFVYDRFIRIRIDMRVLLAEVYRILKVDEETEVYTRKRKSAYAKQIYAVLASELFPKATVRQIGEPINKDHSTISYYLKEILLLKVEEKVKTLNFVKKELMI